MWWPVPGAGVIDLQVNSSVAAAYDEGMRSLAVGANRAAAVMFRSALHLFVKDKGSDKAQAERHLKTALKHMKNDGDLHRSLWEWAPIISISSATKAPTPRTTTTSRQRKQQV